MVAEDVASNRFGRPIHTRFPPEPNGYLHIGHAKSICLNFGIAREFGGRCNLRFDDTNPTTEDVEYVEAIQDDVRWLGFEWDEELYAQRLLRAAVRVRRDADRRRARRTSTRRATRRSARTAARVTEPGTHSPYRDRTVEENLDLLRAHAGRRVPRRRARAARQDRHGASPNMNMRDPLLLPHPARAALPHRRRVVHLPAVRLRAPAVGRDRGHHALALHARVQGQPRHLRLARARVRASSDPPEQTEFARLELDYTVMSKRKLLRLVNEGHVSGWDDPRMPTIAGLRRRGVTPEAHPRLLRRDRRGAQADSAIELATLRARACATTSTCACRA